MGAGISLNRCIGKRLKVVGVGGESGTVDIGSGKLGVWFGLPVNVAGSESTSLCGVGGTCGGWSLVGV